MKTVWQMLAMSWVAGVAALAHGLLLGMSAARIEAPEGSVSLAEALAWPAVLWVDSRPAREFRQGHFPGALHVHPSDWESGLARLLERWDPEARVVVYCDGHGCDISREMAARLREDLGLERVYWLRGGWEQLRESGVGR